MLVFQTLVDLDLDEKFVALALLVNGFLWDDFGGQKTAGLLVDCLVGFCEAART